MPSNDELQQQIDELKAQLAAITTPSHAAIVNQMSALLGTWQAREDQLRDFYAGSPTGGPNGDGYFPLTDSTGFTRLTPTFAVMAANARVMQSVLFLNQNAVTLDASHSGKRIRISNPATTIVTFAKGLPADWHALVCRIGTGAVAFAVAAGDTFQQDQTMDRLRARWSIAAVIADVRTNGNTTIIASGSMVQS